MIELEDRWLTRSGVTIVPPESAVLQDAIRRGITQHVRVTEVVPEIVQFNKFALAPIREVCNDDFRTPSPTLNVPEPYSSMDMYEFLVGRLESNLSLFPKSEWRKRIERFNEEFEWLSTNGKIPLLKMLAYVVEMLSMHHVPWGVGRGSSVGSYVMYLLEVHDIDPVRFDLDWREFMRDADD